MSGSLHQMTAEYVPVQDRILFRVNTTELFEYKIWLTRRLVKGLWGIAVKSFEAKPEVKAQPKKNVQEAVMSMKHQEAVQASNFSQKHETKTKPPPDLETDDALLAVGTRAQTLKNGLLRLTFVTAEGKAVNLNMTDEMLHAVCHILQTASDRAGWDLRLSVGDAAAFAGAQNDQVH